MDGHKAKAVAGRPGGATRECSAAPRTGKGHKKVAARKGGVRMPDQRSGPARGIVTRMGGDRAARAGSVELRPRQRP